MSRPDFAHRGLEEQTLGEAMLPSDITELWNAYRALSPELRQQFLQAAANYAEVSETIVRESPWLPSVHSTASSGIESRG